MTETPKTPDLAQVPGIVTTHLAEFFAAQRPAIAPLGDAVGSAVTLLENYVLTGGKRIRPCYVWAGFVAGGGLRNRGEVLFKKGFGGSGVAGGKCFGVDSGVRVDS